MATQYTVGQIQSMIASVANQLAVNNGFTGAQTVELQQAAEGAASIETSGYDYNNAHSIGNGESVYGLYQLEVPGGEGAAYASNPGALLNPQLNAQIAIGHMAQVLKANPGITDPGILAVTAQAPYNPGTTGWSNYAAEVDANGPTDLSNANSGTYNAVVINSPVSSGAIPNAPSNQAMKNFKWYEPWTWAAAISNEYLNVGTGVVGVIFMIYGIMVVFGKVKGIGSISITPAPQSNNSGGSEEPTRTVWQSGEHAAEVAALA